ncbi:hypothetical protein L1049_004221 [Liquidambar formosana]|uniref:Uncharacterized protein n=1 Tax=Liquidambar formosana TaxID=63359 RepID=A0AAP0RMY4_LIQFO
MAYSRIAVAKHSHFLSLDDKEGASVRRRGRPRKRRNVQGKKLFHEHSSSDEEDSISGSDQDAQDEEDKQEEEEEVPLIHSLRSSAKLRSLRVSREENEGQTRTGDSGRATDNVAASRTSGASN